MIAAALADLQAGLDPAVVDKAEAALIGYAGEFEPVILRKLGARILDHVAPQVAEAAEAQPLARQEGQGVRHPDGHPTEHESQIFDGAWQKAYDAKGTEFSNDGPAETMANKDNETFLEEITPGNAVKSALIYDVPKGTRLIRMELHDSMFLGGVSVNLS